MSKVYPVVLMLNDIHISKDNISDFSLNWNEALSVCDKLGISDIAFGGDLFPLIPQHILLEINLKY